MTVDGRLHAAQSPVAAFSNSTQQWHAVLTCGTFKYHDQPPLTCIVQELCESGGGRPGLSVLTSLLVSVDVKIYCTVLRHWSQLVPNMSHDI